MVINLNKRLVKDVKINGRINPTPSRSIDPSRGPRVMNRLNQLVYFRLHLRIDRALLAQEFNLLLVVKKQHEMVITIDGEALVAYRAVAAQAATEANQICLDTALAAQGAALHVANEIANNGWCALTAKPVVDQAD